MQASESYYNSIDIDQTPAINKWRECVAVPTVGPDGAFCVTFFDRGLMKLGRPISQGLTPVAYTAETGIALTRWARDRGHVLYEDLCKGHVKGAEASEEHWTLWRRVADLYASGRTLRSGALEQAAKRLGLKHPYHPEVYRRREIRDQGGIMSADVDDLMQWLGLGDGAPAQVDDLFADEAPSKKGGKR